MIHNLLGEDSIGVWTWILESRVHTDHQLPYLWCQHMILCRATLKMRVKKEKRISRQVLLTHPTDYNFLNRTQSYSGFRLLSGKSAGERPPCRSGTGSEIVKLRGWHLVMETRVGIRTSPCRVHDSQRWLSGLIVAERWRILLFVVLPWPQQKGWDTLAFNLCPLWGHSHLFCWHYGISNRVYKLPVQYAF